MTAPGIENFEFVLYCAFCPKSVSDPKLPEAFHALSRHYIDEHLIQYENEACPDCMPLRDVPA